MGKSGLATGRAKNLAGVTIMRHFLNCKTMFLGMAAVLLQAGHAMAGEELTYSAQDEGAAGQINYLYSVRRMPGFDLKNKQGHTVGQVHEIIVDDNRDVIDCVIISAAGKLCPVPWAAFECNEMDGILDITRECLRQAPSIATADLQQLSDVSFRNTVQKFYSSQISSAEKNSAAKKAAEWMKEKRQQIAKSGEKPSLYKSDEIIGCSVQDTGGQELGEITDIVADARNGVIAYTFVSFGGFMGIGAKIAAVPWSSVTIMPDRKTAMINAATQTLEEAVVDPEDLAKLAESQLARTIHNNFGAEPYWEVFGFSPAEEVSLIPWQAGSAYNRRFDPTKIMTIEGTIRGVESYYPEKEAAAGLSLKVESKQNELITVYVGPRRYAASQNIEFEAGSAIIVRGSKVTFEDKPVLMASELIIEGETVRLYDEKGRPLWKFGNMTEKN